MEKYKLKIIDGLVSLWGEEGQGEQLETKFLELEQEIETLDTENIVKVINNLLCTSLEKDDLYFNNGAYGMFSLIENHEGAPDEKGGYIVDYTFTIEKLSPLVNLEKLFTNQNYWQITRTSI